MLVNLDNHLNQIASRIDNGSGDPNYGELLALEYTLRLLSYSQVLGLSRCSDFPGRFTC